MSMLRIDGLHVSYGPIPAVRGASLEVAEGDLRVILGANGAGKTSILRAILGLIKPTAGEVFYDGRSIRGFPPHRVGRLGIAWVPEGRRLWSSLSVLDNIRLGAFANPDRSLAGDRIQSVLDRFPILRERQRQLAGSLSGGEQQMVAICRALVGNPRLILMDEPSLGLAPIMVDRVFELVREISASGVTILMVEQNARQALRVANWAYVIEVGRITMDGPPTAISESAQIKEAFLGGQHP